MIYILQGRNRKHRTPIIMRLSCCSSHLAPSEYLDFCNNTYQVPLNVDMFGLYVNYKLNLKKSLFTSKVFHVHIKDAREKTHTRGT